MSIFDTVYKRIHGTKAENASPDYPVNIGGVYYAMDAVLVSGISAGTLGYLRMTQQRELVVAEVGRTDQFESGFVASGSDIRGSVTNWYASDIWPLTTAFFNGADAGFDANPRYIQIPMMRFSRGCLIGFQNGLGGGLSVDVDLYATIGLTTTNQNYNRVLLDQATVPNGSGVYFQPYPVTAGGSASARYVPGLLLPCAYVTLTITPSGDPASGLIMLAVSR